MTKEPIQTLDIGRASESIAEMVADWYGNAPLPNARITAEVIAQRLARFASPGTADIPEGILDQIIEKCRIMIRERDDHEPRGQGVISGLLYAIQIIEEARDASHSPNDGEAKP